MGVFIRPNVCVDKLILSFEETLFDPTLLICTAGNWLLHQYILVHVEIL